MSKSSVFSLQDIADKLAGRVIGDPQISIDSLATLANATSGQLSFLSNPKYRKQLGCTRASAVLLTKQDAEGFQGNAVVVEDPYLAYARLTQVFDWRAVAGGAIHPTAVIDDTAVLADNVTVGPYSVIGPGVNIGKNSILGAHVSLERNCVIGANCYLSSQIAIYPECVIGDDCIIHSGVIIGADGFGFARDSAEWVKICQLGGVVIGDRVEIGAGTTIDRGALENTVIGDGVKLDNQIQIAHNVKIGKDSAIAGCTAVAGSTKIGERCTIAGMSGITGHLEIADDSHVTAMTLVSKSIKKPGVYSSGTGVEPHSTWKKNVVRFRQLDDMSRRIKNLEKTISKLSIEGRKE